MLLAFGWNKWDGRGHWGVEGSAAEEWGGGEWKRRKGELGEFWNGLVIMNVNRRLLECRYSIQ